MGLKLLRNLFFVCVISLLCLPVQGQQDNQLDYDRMIRRLYTAQDGIFKLPYDTDYIQSEILQQVYKKRAELCPNYPSRNNSFSQDYKGYKSWIINFEDEYFAYIKYIEKLIRSHQ